MTTFFLLEKTLISPKTENGKRKYSLILSKSSPAIPSYGLEKVIVNRARSLMVTCLFLTKKETISTFAKSQTERRPQVVFWMWTQASALSLPARQSTARNVWNCISRVHCTARTLSRNQITITVKATKLKWGCDFISPACNKSKFETRLPTPC